MQMQRMAEQQAQGRTPVSPAAAPPRTVRMGGANYQPAPPRPAAQQQAAPPPAKPAQAAKAAQPAKAPQAAPPARKGAEVKAVSQVSRGAARRAVGAAREATAARLTEGQVSGERIGAPNLGHTDVDVTAKNGDLVMVGGPKKAGYLGNLGRVIKIYQCAAGERISHSNLSHRRSNMTSKKYPDWRTFMDEGKALLLGAELFRSVVSEKRPIWIGGILESVLAATQLDFMGFGQRMVAICRDKSAWGTAEHLFLELRQSSLRSENERAPVECAMADLVEVAAKVVFNASGARPGFDLHAGARVLPLVWHIMRLIDQGPAQEEALCLVEDALWRGAKKGR
ncbi:hypothetical protein [Sorangium sp. So ce854]|uniref:hypothetical protein n=1 Tax=Sorangium sp. So ce854 TaxID=3133322 RepID=UPI003F62C249